MKIERNNQNISLREIDILKLVHPCFPTIQHLDDWKLLSGGAVNTTYRLTIGNDEYILRLYLRDPHLCFMEKNLHTLIENRVPVPKLFYADVSHHPYPYAIFQYIQGESLYQLPKHESRALSLELGGVLGSIHSFKFTQAGFFGNDLSVVKPFEMGSSPYFDETFAVLSKDGYARKRLGNALSDKLLFCIEKNKDLFPIVEEGSISLVHSDFKPVNLIYGKEGRIWVIDWEFAHAGHHLIDFSILLRYRHLFPLDLEMLKEGYLRAGGTLQKDWERSALIVDFVNIVTLLEHPSKRPELFQEMKMTLKKNLKILEN